MSNKNQLEPVLDIAPLQKFSPVEINLLLQIISYAWNSRERAIRIPFEQLKELSNYKMSATKLFTQDLESAFDKLMELNLTIKAEDGSYLEKFNVFTGFEINASASEPYVEIIGHDKALPLVNTLDRWILDSLQEFLKLNSGYSKTMFRLLKQFSQTGTAYFSKEEFIEQLSIPSSYKQGDIDRSVIAPIEEELTPLFKGLSVKKEYGSGRGKPVKGYRFTFEADK